MALYDEVVRDASLMGGIFRFEEVAVAEGTNWRIELPHQVGGNGYLLDNGDPFDFTVLTGVVAGVTSHANDATNIIALTFEAHAEGWFALLADDSITAGLAGASGANPNRRNGLRFYCRGTLPDGRIVQIVDWDSRLVVKHKGA